MPTELLIFLIPALVLVIGSIWVYKMNNPVAKHARTFNKSHVFKDRKKEARNSPKDLDYEDYEEYSYHDTQESHIDSDE